jgi:tRNA(Ile)-lysidine synthase
VVEHTTHNRAVAGSIPASATNIPDQVDRSRLVPPGSRVLVGLSGGPDSTALLLALLALNRDVVAAHFDHALRDSSEGDAAFVADLCRRHHVPLIGERRRAPLEKGSVQAAARKARYDFLLRAQTQANADMIAVAHTSDDQVETVLMNLLRGTGVAGLRGIPASRPPIVRPLLSATREGVLAYLEEMGERALDDPSNADLR